MHRAALQARCARARARVLLGEVDAGAAEHVRAASTSSASCSTAQPGRERPAPRYSPEDLARCMPRYSVERGRLLRNGMQEFLFKL